MMMLTGCSETRAETITARARARLLAGCLPQLSCGQFVELFTIERYVFQTDSFRFSASLVAFYHSADRRRRRDARDGTTVNQTEMRDQRLKFPGRRPDLCSHAWLRTAAAGLNRH